MSRRYTNNGKRISSMTHARRGHACSFCPFIAHGNGGEVSHARSHVRRGEAIELVKEFGLPMGTGRVFLAPDDERINEFRERGYTQYPDPEESPCTP